MQSATGETVSTNIPVVLTLHVGHNFSMKLFKDNIPFKIFRDVSFTELLVRLCKIMLSGFFFSKGFRYCSRTYRELLHRENANFNAPIAGYAFLPNSC